MAEGVSNSLVNLGELAKPAETLIKKISKAVGGVFAPYQIKRLAKADAEAAVIKAESEIQITDLHRRAMHRFFEEEALRQTNIEDISRKALPHLTNAARPDAVEDDWIANFFDKCRIVSDSDMQSLWSRVLAGEANIPGTYSKRTVNFLSDLSKADAELFRQLCGFGWVVIGEITPLVFDPEAEIYTRRGIDFDSLIHLDSIGLIKFDSEVGFAQLNLPRCLTTHYYSTPLALEFEQNQGNALSLGRVLFTKIGEEFAPICGSVPVNGFVEYVCERWSEFLPKK